MDVQDRVKAHRDKMRQRGYRPVQLWVPDVRTQAFADQALSQSRLLAAHDQAVDDQDFVEAISAPWDND